MARLAGRAVLFARQRQSAILDLVRRCGGVRVTHLAQRFDVSDKTIRRDLEVLAGLGLVHKVYGGATLGAPGVAREPGFAAKAGRQRAEKTAIAQCALTAVRPGMAIALSAGTTTATLAGLLTTVPGLTVVTNSIPVADALYRAPAGDRTIVLTGGIRTRSGALAGPVAEAAVRAITVDLLFLGVHGMSPHAGFTTPNLLEASIDRRLIAVARRLIVLADHTKWATVGLVTIAPLASAAVVITDSGLSADGRAQLRQRVGEVVVVEPDRSA